MADQQFCLRWNNHQNTLISVFDSLLEGEILVDCTLAAEGKFLRAHKVVLSACSPFFSDLLRQHYEKHPILIMKDVKFDQLKAMLDYMYRGEVNISQDQLGTFLKAAESLQIKGLSDSTQNYDTHVSQKVSSESRAPRATSKPEDDLLSSRLDDTSPSPTLRRKKRRLHSGSGDESVIEENSSDQVHEASVPHSKPPVNLMVSSNPPSPLPPSSFSSRGEDTPPSDEASGSLPTRTLAVSTSLTLNKNGSSRQQPTPIVDNELYEPKAEFIELEGEEDLIHDDDNMDAGPSHSSNDGAGLSWHMDRPEDSFLSQESMGGHRNAQDTWYPTLPSHQEVAVQQYGPYSCPRCGRKYAVLYTLERHLRYECGVDKQFGCPVCLRRFSRRDVLRTHQKNSGHYSESEKSAKTFMDMIALSACQRKT